RATATTPSARGIHPDVGAAATFISSVVAAWPMLVIDSSRPKREPTQRVEIRPFRCPPDRWVWSTTDAFIQQCCRIATIPGRAKLPYGRSEPQRRPYQKRISRYCGRPEYRDRGFSSARYCD